MAQVLVRNLDDAVVERLRRRAEGNHRSLEAELRDILEQASRQVSMAEAAEIAGRIRARLAATGRTFGDSAELIREDRDR